MVIKHIDDILPKHTKFRPLKKKLGKCYGLDGPIFLQWDMCPDPFWDYFLPRNDYWSCTVRKSCTSFDFGSIFACMYEICYSVYYFMLLIKKSIGYHGNCCVAMEYWQISMLKLQWSVYMGIVTNVSTMFWLILRYHTTYLRFSWIHAFIFEKGWFLGMHMACLSPWQRMMVVTSTKCISHFKWVTPMDKFYVLKWWHYAVLFCLNVAGYSKLPPKSWVVQSSA